MVLVLRFLVVEGISESITITDVRLVGAVAGMMLWVQILFWLRLFDSTAQYVSLVMRTVSNIFSFMIVLLMFMFAFGTAMYLLQMNRIYEGQEEDGLLYPFQPGQFIFYTSME